MERPVFGIDLGTTYSCITYIDAYQDIVVIPNAEGDKLTPSVVYFEGNNRIVGKEALALAQTFPEQVVTMVKRQMGIAHWRFAYDGQQYSPEEISSYILRKLAQAAEQQTGYAVQDVVITCPAYFDIPQREATARAGQLAGLHVLEVINEPTAAAIAYGLQEEKDATVLLYDLGGGTFDVTIIKIQQGAIRVLATGGDSTRGGHDWDEAIVLYLVQEWQKQTGASDDILESAETMQELWQQAEDAKRALTFQHAVVVPVFYAGQEAEIVLSRETFYRLTAHLLEQTLFFTRATLEEARKQGCTSIDQILLVGGSTRMPQVMARLQEEFQMPIHMYDPDEAVAKGAALYGYKLKVDREVQEQLQRQQATQASEIGALPQEISAAQQTVAREQGVHVEMVKTMNNTAITNVASHSFGVFAKRKNGESGEYSDVISNLVLLNTPLPYGQQRTYTVLEGNRELVEIKIMENMLAEEIVENPAMGQTIGTIQLPLPKGLPAGAPIEVFFEMNNQGRLSIKGRELSSGTQIEATLQTEMGLSPVEMEQAQERQQKLFIA